MDDIFYLMMLSRHFLFMLSDIWKETTQIEKEKTMPSLQGLIFSTKVSFISPYHRQVKHTTTFFKPVLVYK